MATNDADPREAAKAQERQLEDGVFLGGDDFPPHGGSSDPSADPDPAALGFDPDLGDDPQAGDEPTAFEWPEDVEVPERLKGKSVSDIAKEFASLQTEFGRQTTELGETRAAIRDLVQEQLLNQRTNAETKPKKEISFEDLESNPTAAIRDLVTEAVQEALEPVKVNTEQAQLQAQVANIQARYPDLMATVQSEGFKSWVQASPYRQRVYDRANAYDFEAIEELLSGYREVKALQEQDAGQTRSVRAKSTVKGGGGGRSPVKRGRIYTYAEIARLYNTNREQYNALYPEFEKAEAEGRIK